MLPVLTDTDRIYKKIWQFPARKTKSAGNIFGKTGDIGVCAAGFVDEVVLSDYVASDYAVADHDVSGYVVADHTVIGYTVADHTVIGYTVADHAVIGYTVTDSVVFDYDAYDIFSAD